MEEKIEVGKFCSLEQLAKAGYKKNDHGIGSDEIYIFSNGHISWLFRNLFTGIVDNIVTNYN
ncbi:MAG: hypothetical protein WCO07_02395 [bacterium]